MKRSETAYVSLAALKSMKRASQMRPWALPGAFDQSAPVSDPYSSTANSLFSMGNTARTIFGRITDATQVAHVYRVHCGGGMRPIIAVDGHHTGTLFGGAHQLNTYPVGQDVLLVWDERYPWGIILCALPTPGSNPQLAHPSIISTTSRQRVDEAHKLPMRMHDASHIPSATGGRPMDSTGVGEWGVITDTGLKFFLDPFMAMMGVDETCGVTAFYHDQMLRVAGYNMQLWTAAREMESLDDEGELADCTGYAMYPWEQLGQSEPGACGRVLPPEEWQTTSPHLSKIEPVDEAATAFQREREWHGYHGQGGKTTVQAPPVSGEMPKIGEDAKCPGLIDISRTADGQLHLSAARGISLMKRPIILSPFRKANPAQPGDTGDNPENYKASGRYGSGPDHKVTGGPAVSATEHISQQRIAGLADKHAYDANFGDVHPFVYHDKDYYVPEESETDWTGGIGQAVPQFSTLADAHGIDTEQHKHEVTIDHRFNKQAIYALLSAFDMLDDGSIKITAGSGASLTLGADGNAYIDAPGDIVARSGRNIINWAGQDFVTRAQNAFDITASKGQGRIKTEKDLFVLAANSGQGGMHLESRSAGNSYNFDELGEKAQSAGIVLRCMDSVIGTQARDIYARTIGGTITLDADRGKQSIIGHASDMSMFLQTAAFLHYGSEGAIRSSTQFAEKSNVISGPTCINGGLGLKDNLYMIGSILVAGGHIYTEEAQRNTDIYPLKAASLGETRKAAEECAELAEEEIPNSAKKLWNDGLNDRWYGSKQLGNDDLIARSSASLRTQEDYRTSNFVMYEASWQQLARLSGQSLPVWDEPAVSSRGQQTYPYPGKEKFESDSFMQQDLAIFDAQAQRAKDRGAADSLADIYAEPTLPEPTPISLKKYPVIRSAT